MNQDYIIDQIVLYQIQVDESVENADDKIKFNYEYMKTFLNYKDDNEIRVVGMYGTLEQVQNEVRKQIENEQFQFNDQIRSLERAFICGVKSSQLLLICGIFPISYFLDKPIREKSIEITLYRILQDLARNIIFCPPQKIFEEWYDGDQIPFEQSQVNRSEQYEIEENVVKNITTAEVDLKILFDTGEGQNWKEVECLNQSNISLRYKFQVNNHAQEIHLLNYIISSFILHQTKGSEFEIEGIIKQFPDSQQFKVFLAFQKIQVELVKDLMSFFQSFYHKLYNSQKSIFKYDDTAKQEANQIFENIKQDLFFKNETFFFTKVNSQRCDKLTQIYRKYSKIFIQEFNNEGKEKARINTKNIIEILSYQPYRDIQNDLKYVSLSILSKIEYQYQIETKDFEIINILPTNCNSQMILIIKSLSQNMKPMYTFFLTTKNNISNQLIQLHIKWPCFCWQQCSKKLFIFNHQSNNVIHLIIDEKGKLDEKIYPISNEEKVIIKCAVYSNLSKQFILLTQQGKLLKWSTEEDNFCQIIFSKDQNQCKENFEQIEQYNLLYGSENSKYYFLSTQKIIDIYDQNFLRIKRIELDTPTNIKIFQDDSDIFIFGTKLKNIIVLPGLSSNQQFKQKDPQNKIEKIGNPYIDIIKGSQQSFGYTSQKAISSVTSTVTEQQAKLLDEYIEQIELKNYQHCGFQQKDYKIKSKDLLILFYSQVPLQICTIENQSIIPLVNGFKQLINEETRLTIQQQAMTLRFGFLENLQNLCNETLFVVSIVGNQSSGKSYLMNKLFGTKFSVSASRCTDGIWINFVKIQNSNFLVMDCEGLFSPRRTKQEESQFLAILAAVSDITILNQNLSVNRNLSKLFKQLTNSIGTLRGDSLFKGQLLLAVRDVGNDSQGAKDEYLRYLREISHQSEDQNFLKQLFNNKFVLQLFNNFQQKSFEKEIKILREDILEMANKKKNCLKDLLSKIKILLIQVQKLDSENVDKLHYELKIEDLYNQSLINWKQFTSALQHGEQQPIEEDFNDQSDFTLEDKLNEQSFRVLLDSIINQFNLSLQTSCFNENIQKANSIIQTFLTERKKIIVNNLQEEYNLFKTHVSEDILRNKVKVLENQLEQYQEKYKICGAKCDSCYLLCSKCMVHNQQPPLDKENLQLQTNHDCLRESHLCDQKCQICNTQDTFCKLSAGHPNEHLCQKQDHKCINKCEIGECTNNCTMSYNHASQHSCGNKHQCKEKCQYCNSQCFQDIQQYHTIHECQNNSCDWMCYLCKQINQVRKCRQGHEHTKDTCEKSHQCENDHQCFQKCQQKGICQISYEEIQMKWQTKLDRFDYTYYKQIDQGKIQCQEVIKVNQDNHDGIEHSCKNKIHYCYSKCPECQCFCSKPYGHEGNHSSMNHRNKELQCFTTTENIKHIQIENYDKTVKKYEVSESSKPETCKGSCSRRGRSHFHLIRCPGGNQCYQKQLSKGARHQTQPYKGFEDWQFDEILCIEFWKSQKWDNPIQDIDDLEKNQKCNCYCPDCKLDSFCIRDAWHTDSKSYFDHKFLCSEKHQYNYQGLDLVFVIDATASMQGYIKMVKDKIKSIMNKAQSKIVSLRCGVVAYRDHPPEEKEFVTKIQRLSSLFECIAFLDNLKANGGGDYPEAVLDGLDEAIKLQWKQDHNKILFLIGDAPPHGRLYHNDSDRWPNGCPCLLKDTVILEQMKKQKINLKILALNQGLSMMIQRFKSFYNTIEIISASSEIQFGNILENKIVGLLQQIEITAQISNR